MITLSYQWMNRLPRRWIVNTATLGPMGYLTKAPGTVGSVLGVVLYLLFWYPLPGFTSFFLTLVFLYLAVGFCDHAARFLGRQDPQEIILDECAAIPLCFFGVGHIMHDGYMGLFLVFGFIFFRILDIFKPFKIREMEKKFSGGLGIVADDVLAAIYTAVSLNVLGWILD